MLRIVGSLLLVLWLAACAQYQNPVSTNRLATAEAAYGIALSAANAYRDVCNKKIIERKTCAPVVEKLQALDRGVQVALDNLRRFQKEHPFIDAISFIIVIENAVSDFKAYADKEAKT